MKISVETACMDVGGDFLCNLYNYKHTIFAFQMNEPTDMYITGSSRSGGTVG